MIDLHSHILYDIDDGAKSLNESIGLCKKALLNDIGVIIATPHFDCRRKLEPFLKNRDRQFEILTEVLEEEAVKIELGKGAEVFLNEGLLNDVDLKKLTINNSRYLLCEFAIPPFDPDMAIIYIENVLSQGLIPIVAHPERYITFLQRPYLIKELLEMGTLFQVNMDSLAGAGGPEITTLATALIVDGIADFIATDTHSLNFRQNDILHKKLQFDDSIAPEMLDHCLCDAPLSVIKDEIITK